MKPTPADASRRQPTPASVPARLAELAPVPDGQFYSLTTRHETLELILALLASRRALGGYEPYTYTVEDYLHAFS